VVFGCGTKKLFAALEKLLDLEDRRYFPLDNKLVNKYVDKDVMSF